MGAKAMSLPQTQSSSIVCVSSIVISSHMSRPQLSNYTSTSSLLMMTPPLESQYLGSLEGERR